MSTVTINYHLGKDILEVVGDTQDVITVAKALMYTDAGKRTAKLSLDRKLPQIDGDFSGLAKRDSIKKAATTEPKPVGKIHKGKLVPQGTWMNMVVDASPRLKKGQELSFPNNHNLRFDQFASGIRTAVTEVFGAGSYQSRKTQNGTLAVKLLK